MRILAIETATEACSVALFEGEHLLGAHHETLGRGHAERLVPMIATLPDRGRADEIRVSLGPGSFTGTRIGVAAARALGVAWGVTVRGYPTLSLVAAMAQAQQPGPVTVCMTGGHGEWFVQNFDRDGAAEAPLVSLRPEQAALFPLNPTLAGSQASALATLAGASGAALELLPDARHVLGLPLAVLSDALAPLYGRPPDAKLPV